MGLGQRWLDAAYRGSPWLTLLRPLELLYRREVERRAKAYRQGSRQAWRASVPVIVVGNLTLGGTGKSPLVAWLARRLKEQGCRPGVLSRGYGGKSDAYPLLLTPTTEVAECGDEPRMLADQTGLPVVVDPDRPRGAQRLIDEGCDVIVTDDGLQHHALARDIELVVVDGRRGFGNRRCLPAGPLREPLTRLSSVDALLINGDGAASLPAGYRMRLEPSGWRRLGDSRVYPPSPLPFDGPVVAVAGIGHPQRFFATLDELGVDYLARSFSDHHRYTPADVTTDNGQPMVMTAKDAVKCRDLAPTDGWVLDVEARPDPDFIRWFDQRTAGWSDGRRDTAAGASGADGIQ
ncbi:tetraacyldisaccharide 4'-kinase [Halomonas denitrificans]|uniref:tetraacyldisaccharide 4'-kinase n=1 Tax=Halomonas denitrificans TaxID=370769 RepID=UPI001C9943DC|nr:tetraacyldisaccharide 4'-kinase [Halomonas denitrificans]MBY5969381.1 tetraacyldisaccharide 4'-kinase [Halomonas denitrificans]